jgi:GT2 family glycosyltransferase
MYLVTRLPREEEGIRQGKHEHSVSVLVVIVNYRTADLTIRCLRSLTTETEYLGNCRIQVVDNASNDNSVERIRSAIQMSGWGAWVSVNPLSNNGGFASGNNAAIHSALEDNNGPQYFLLLNPDTVVRPGAIRNLITFMEKNPQIGIAGSRLEDADGSLQCSAFRAPTILGELENAARLGPLSRLLKNHSIPMPIREEPHECEWVAGASMMVRRKVFEEIGIFDDQYFLYYEEVDFCCRARQSGWKVFHVPDSRVIHLEGQATGIRQLHRARPAYWFNSRRRYFLKNYGLIYAIGADIARITGFGLWRLRRMIQRKPDQDPPHFLRDLICNSVFIKGWEQGK